MVVKRSTCAREYKNVNVHMLKAKGISQDSGVGIVQIGPALKISRRISFFVRVK